MDKDALRTLFFSFPEVTEETPFDELTFVYKVAGKMFALTDWEKTPLNINLKCDPAQAEELREEYSCVLPGYHMNKKHWNTVIVDGSVENQVLKFWIEHSFERVVMGFSKTKREQLIADWRGGVMSSPPDRDDELRSQMREMI